MYILRLSAFLLHFLSALFITYVTLRCGSTFVTHSYAEGRNGTGYAVLTDSTCQEDCFYDVPPSALSAQVGLEWNVFALLAAFEFISAGFALWHLDPLGPWRIVAYLWNLAGILLLAPYATHMSLLQYSITALSLLVGTAVQMYPIGREGDGITSHGRETRETPVYRARHSRHSSTACSAVNELWTRGTVTDT